jgi:hypothetical protein
MATRVRTAIRDWSIGLCYALPVIVLLVVASNTEGVVSTIAWVAFFVVFLAMIVHGFLLGRDAWDAPDDGDSE